MIMHIHFIIFGLAMFDPRVEYKQPEFIEQIHHVHAKVGQAATFTCRVKGTPNPFVRW